MMEWWTAIDAGLISAILGGGLGSLAGIYGAAAGLCAPRGIGRRALLSAHVVFLGIGAASLIAGVVALIAGQPQHVFYPLLLTGFVVTVVLGALLPAVRTRYAQAEARRMDAEAIRRS